MKRTSSVLGNTMGNTRLTDFQQVFEALRSDIPSNLFETGTTYALADLGGRARRAPPPPYGSRFFRFDMQNF